jgi:penicillin-insensitive murein endopeptidase
LEASPAREKKFRFRRRYFFMAIIVAGILMSLPQIFYKQSPESQSIGSVRDGKLINGWLIPHRGKNFHYFSGLSYYVLANAYVHSKVYRTLLAAYKTCELTSPNTFYHLMECSYRNGGRMWFHWTHQNGVSVDFMVPTKNGKAKTILSNYIGLLHYLLKFSPDGKFSLNRNTEIDFEAMAQHLIALDDAAKVNGLRIRKVLFHTDLHDELFNTAGGQELLKHNLRFIPHLDNLVNRFHDDHYHVDFEFVDSPD